MKHPALTRVMAVTLAVFCLVTLIAGGGSIWKLHGDHREDLRQRQLLCDRTDRAAALSARLDEMQSGYESASHGLEDRQKAHDAQSSDYRVRLATYTATRAGIVMGRSALDQAAALLETGEEQLAAGRALFDAGAAAFEEIYEVYAAADDGVQRSREIYEEGMAYLEANGSQGIDDAIDPDTILTAISLTSAGIDVLEEVVRGAADEPVDGSAAADSIRQLQALAAQASAQPGSMDPQALAALAVRETVSQADALIQERMAAGASEQEALAEADALCQTTLGMSYAEAKSWLQENSDSQGGGGNAFSALAQMDPDQIAELMTTLGGDEDLLQNTLVVLDEEKEMLSAQEEAMRADPAAMSSSEALLALLKTELDSADKIYGMVSGVMENAKEQIDAIEEQLDQAERAIEAGKHTISAGRRQLAETERELERQREEMLKEKRELLGEAKELWIRRELVEEYEATERDYRSARSALMSYESVSAEVKAGADLIESAEKELAEMTLQQQREYGWRLAIALTMLAACLPGALCAAGAFERPKLKRPWLPAILCAALCAAGEAASVWLGRGLWYSALFLAITSLSLLPLTLGKKA